MQERYLDIEHDLHGAFQELDAHLGEPDDAPVSATGVTPTLPEMAKALPKREQRRVETIELFDPAVCNDPMLIRIVARCKRLIGARKEIDSTQARAQEIWETTLHLLGREHPAEQP